MAQSATSSAARTSIGENIVVSAVNVVAVVGASLVAVPLIIDHLGLAGYGLWTLGQSFVIYVSTVELGVGPAISRFVSVRHREHHEVLPILWLALGLYALAGLALIGVAHFAAEPLVDLFKVPLRFHADAIRMTQIVGFVAFAALVAAALGQVLTGLERYRPITVTNAAGSCVFLGGLLILLPGHARLTDVADAALAQWTVVAVTRGAVLLPLALTERPRLPRRTAVRELAGFSARLQIAVLATLLNTQTDRIVVGLVSTARVLGQVGIATQVAEAGRFLANSALVPLVSRMAVTYGASGPQELDMLYGELLRRWQLMIVGSLAILIAVMQPMITAWLGPGHSQAAYFAVLLTIAYGCNLLMGPAIAYLRAVGKPGYEGVYGLATVAANIILTVGLGAALGADGVIIATLIAYAVSTLWFSHRVAKQLPRVTGTDWMQWTRSVAVILVSALIALGVGRISVVALPTGVAVVGVGAGITLAFGIYLASVVGLTPMLGTMKRLFPTRRSESRQAAPKTADEG